MKKMKKLLSMLLAVVMVLAMTAPSFAEQATITQKGGTITIGNPEATKEYYVYKIFDAAYNTEGNDAVENTYTYTILSNSDWYTFVSGYANIDLVPTGETLANNIVRYYVKPKDNFSAPDFAAALKIALDGEKKEDGTEVPPTVTGVNPVRTLSKTTTQANELDLGYYFVKTNNGSLCNLTTTNPSITIYDKNVKPTVDKDIDAINGTNVTEESERKESNVQVGDVVRFEITGNVPDLTGYTTYVYNVIDTMSKGLEYLSSDLLNYPASITINDEPVTGVGATVEHEEKDGVQTGRTIITFPIDLLNKGYEYGELIKVVYYARVTEAAANGTDPVTNQASLEFSNDPSNSASKDKTDDPDPVKVYTANIVIDKYDGSDATKNTKLNGAEFVLKNSSGMFYKYDATTPEGKWVSEQTNATVYTTTGTDENDKQLGAVTIYGLKNGNYELVEIKAPNGFNILQDPVSVQINTEATADRVYSVTKEVMNNRGSILPGTGGIGTTIFYAVGIILMAGAVFFVVRRKRA